jgi:t-SNARE complex subunit (syntaxin)
MQDHTPESVIKSEFDKQDKKLGEISEVLTDLHHIALNMNTELKDQEGVIDELGKHIDNTNMGIQNTTEKINKLIKSAKNNCGFLSCICFLIIIIIIIIMMIIYIPNSN